MAFIDIIAPAEANEETLAMYERQRQHYGYLPNYAKVFCHRPEVMKLWAQLHSGVRRHTGKRQYELVTFAAANALRSTLCSLAHGNVLTEFFSKEDVEAMARGATPASLSAAEGEMMAFARKVARDATAITREDVETLKAHGLSDAEIFDVAAIAAARAFWTKILDALGVEADPKMRAMESGFREALSVGRPVDFRSSPAEPTALAG